METFHRHSTEAILKGPFENIVTHFFAPIIITPSPRTHTLAAGRIFSKCNNYDVAATNNGADQLNTVKIR